MTPLESWLLLGALAANTVAWIRYGAIRGY